nr:methyltransferase domain-containing protein [Tissierella sp.]
MDDKSKKIKNRYNRISKVYDLMEKPMEVMSNDKWREQLMEKIEGSEVLEVGVGAGKNLLYYREDLNITGIDFSEKMLEKAKKKVKNHKNIDLIEMDAQDMKFEDNTFDTVVTSCVFCSVPDPVKGLEEIRRVCKNGGKVVMLEHMRSNNPLAGRLMDLFNFIPLNIWGANINRRTMENLIRAGFDEKDIQSQDIWTDVVKLIEIRNKK